MSLKVWVIVMFLALLPMPLAAQVDEALEHWAGELESDTQAGAYVDELTELADRRININDTSAMRQLLSPFQLKALGNYITLYGQLLSHNELCFIPGFDSLTVALLGTITIVEPFEGHRRWRLADGRHTFITGFGGTLEQAAGYRDGRYEGDAIQSRMVYGYNLYNQVSVRVAFDKDPVEPWGNGNFYSYHLMLSDIGRLERLVIGRYNLQFGQGLTLWTGLSPFNLLGGTPQRYGRGVRQASTFYEEGYQEGVAATVRLFRSWHATGFASKVHGTRLLGGRMEYRGRNLVSGFTLVQTALDDSISPADRVYNLDYFRGNQLFNAGVDAMWQWNRLLFYGEVSFDGQGAAAALAGTRIMVDSRNSFGISYRHYSKGYHNLVAQPYAIGDGRNELGWTLDARMRLPLKVDALLSADIHSFPSLRYGSYRPSTGTWFRAQIARRFGRSCHVSMRYAIREKERNVPYNDSAVYIGEQTLRRQLMGEMIWELGSWQLATKAAWSYFDSESSGGKAGWLVSQQVRYTQGPLQATLAATIFDAKDYYARIYLTETNLQYNFTLPMYYGQGARLYVVARYLIGSNFTVAAKYAITHYFDRQSVGSGAAETDGSNRQTLYLQLRLKF